MRFLTPLALATILLTLITACTQNRVVVLPVNPGATSLGKAAATPPGSNITEHQFLISEPCLLTAQEAASNTYATAKSVGGASAPMSDRAKTENTEGCASIKFRLSGDGSPVDAAIVRENPKDYGFGQQILSVVQASKYQAPSDTNQWYYQTSVVTRAGQFTHIFSGGPDHYAKYAEYFRQPH